ncbi:MAG: ATP-binding protein [Acidimicrobiaceae bacterium]|nr:ATP-binding protein [Acidimicrobiia bacterium]MCY4493939.1 ATP-binding protein [Acidimicrobiaceae bacterium]
MGEPSGLGTPAGTPFSPHFGGTPNTLVGRDDLLTTLGSGLATGPNDKWYTTIVMGVRGSGKTTILNEIEDRAAADGWVVLSLDAGTPLLLDRIIQAIAQAGRSYESLEAVADTTGRSVGKSLGIRLGPLQGKLEASDFFQSPQTGLREHLVVLAHQAMKYGASVLLTVDEMHAIDRGEGRRLANDIQHVTRRANLPVAFVGAGLLELRHTLMRDRKMTFFHRCEDYELPPLNEIDAINGLASPIEDAGGSITADALRLAASAVDGSPYRLQVIGDAAWRLSDAPAKPITSHTVDLAVTAAQHTVEKNISIPAWHDLTEREKSVLKSLAGHNGMSNVARVAQDTGISNKRASGLLAHLRDSGYVASLGDAKYRMTGLVSPRVALEPEPLEVDSADTEHQTGDRLRRNRPRCRQWMPRARAYCVLTEGHAGRCRSS